CAILFGTVGSPSFLFESIPSGRAICSIFARCLTDCAVSLRSTIQPILARRLPGRTVSFVPFRPQRLFGPEAILLRVALARPVMSLRPWSLSDSLGAAAVLRLLAHAASRPLVAARGCILWRYFLGRCAAFLLRQTFLLSHRSTSRSHRRDNYARYQQVDSIH